MATNLKEIAKFSDDLILLNKNSPFEHNEPDIAFEHNETVSAFEHNETDIAFGHNEPDIAFEHNEPDIAFEHNETVSDFKHNEPDIAFEHNEPDIAFGHIQNCFCLQAQQTWYCLMKPYETDIACWVALSSLLSYRLRRTLKMVYFRGVRMENAKIEKLKNNSCSSIYLFFFHEHMGSHRTPQILKGLYCYFF